MAELAFTVEGAAPGRGAADPLMGFRVRIATADRTPVHSIALRCQVRIQPARRRYSGPEQERLLDLFGTPDRWGRTVRDLLWDTAAVTVPSFTGATVVVLPVSCDRDPARAVARYFDALDDGDVALLLLFSGIVFYEAAGVGLQVGLIPWDREARHRLPVAAWRGQFAEAVAP